jgi:hypothetical protein
MEWEGARRPWRARPSSAQASEPRTSATGRKRTDGGVDLLVMGARRMSQTAAHLVDHVIPHVPVRQGVFVWVMRLPIPLRLLLAAQPELVTAVLQRVLTRHLLEQAGLASDEGHGDAVKLMRNCTRCCRRSSPG